ncbi:MAG: hypothetical protein GX856_00955 [Gammaproteobacteria bacterium]|nr:hypothetical protein [Gammaproteobacteria bacterium]
MQFQLSGTPDAATLAAALRPLDPDARIILDVATSRMEVVSSAGSAEVLAALREAGHAVEPLVHELHISGGSTCCGGCS